MTSIVSLRRALPLIGQCALILFGLAFLYAVPPAKGRILLVPVTVQARLSLAPVAVAHGAQLVSAGPWRGSLLVDGDRNDLVLPLLTQGVVLLSARVGGCEGVA